MSTGVLGSLALLLGLPSPVTIAVPAAPVSEAREGLRGTVRRAGDREVISGASVLVVPAPADARVGPRKAWEFLDPAADPPAWVQTAQTDDEGRFSLPDVQGRRVRVIVVAAGHMRLEAIVDPQDLPRRGLVLFVAPQARSAYRTVVETPEKPDPARVKSTAMQAEEIRTAPGTQGDPLRALQNLPGVARSPGGLGVLVLRGAAPNQSRVFLGGHPLPRAFHALAISSVVPAAAIDRLEFVPGNFGSRYGDATGGVVVLHPAELQRRGTHGHARLDLLGAGALASGPLGKGAYLVAAQRGWVDAVLRTVETIDETQTFLLPRYYDYQAFFEHPLGRRGTLSARVLGAGDRIQSRTLAFATSGEREVAFELGSQFHRADLSYRVRHQQWSFWLTPSFRFERNTTKLPRLPSESIRNDAIMSLRVEASRDLSRRATVLVGADLEVDRYRARVSNASQAFSGALGAPANSDEVERGVQSSLGTYAQLSLGLGRWELAPGLRVSAFTLGSAAEAAIDPRLGAHWSFAPRWRWSMGLGLYSQALVPQRSASGGFIGQLTQQVAGTVVFPSSVASLEPRAGFAPVADAIVVARAAQASTALGREVGDWWFFELGAWARVIDNADGTAFQADGSRVPVVSTWSNAYGLEVLARRSLGPRLWGWLGYTLSRAETRVLDSAGQAVSRAPVPSSFDQRHNLIVLASYRLPRNWRLGGRFRVVSGSPFTGFSGAIWVGDSPFASGAPGPPNGERFPVFHQLDLRVDKSWILDRIEVGTYVDVQNVYNRVNPEAYIYDYDLTSRVNAIGLPIFPSLGLRVDY